MWWLFGSVGKRQETDDIVTKKATSKAKPAAKAAAKPAPKPVAKTKAQAPRPAPSKKAKPELKKPEVKKPEAKKPEVKAAPQPEPKPAPKPKPEYENVELKIELQSIPFDKSELTADNKKELDEFLATEVKPLNTVGAVIITGHTDRIGSQKANKKLSEERAIKARDYLTGKGIDQLIQACFETREAWSQRVGTGELNRFLEEVTSAHAPVSKGKKDVRIMYGTQTATEPPEFILFTNVATELHFSYERFLANQLRERFGFEGTPIRLKVRRRARKGRED